jgi:hypothetical protein
MMPAEQTKWTREQLTVTLIVERPLVACIGGILM